MVKYLKLTLSLQILLLSFYAPAQKKTEIGVVSDNDVYLFIKLDQYYTNGLELFYRKARPTQFGNFYKNIRQFNVGQKIYNPRLKKWKDVGVEDRPYAGYLYFSYAEKFINTKNILTFRTDISYTGKETKAEQAQNFIHSLYGIDKALGWENQVKSEFSLGIYLQYIYNIYTNPDKKWQVAAINDITANFIFTNISSGIALKYNVSRQKTAAIANTSFFDTSLQVDNEKWIRESYFGLKSYLKYQLIDKTVTGKLYNDISHKKFQIQPWVWYLDLGYYLNLEKFTFSYHYIFHTRNVKRLEKKLIRYGSIQISYKF